MIFFTELWPLIDVKISVFLNIFRSNEWMLITFCLCIDIYDPHCDYCAIHKKWQCFTIIQDQRIDENRRRRDNYNHTSDQYSSTSTI